MKRQFFALIFGALGGMLLAGTLRDFENIWTGAGLGALVTIAVVNFDALLDLGIGAMRRVSTNRYWLAVSGAVFGGSLALAFSSVVLVSIGWIGSCWG